MLDLSRQYTPIHDELLAAMGHVLETRQFILGNPVANFEAAAAEHLGVSHAVGCSSGTDALWLALAAANIGPGTAVITTPFSFFASVSSILRAGATPLLSDIDPVSFNLDPDRAENLLQQSQAVPVRALLPVHLYGQCAPWSAFAALGKTYELALIEDAAQAWGARSDGERAGALGDLAAFSFYPTKNLSAAGDAGMVTTNNPELAERLKMLRQHGMRERYHHDEVGWNARMDGFQGAILQVKLKYISEWNEKRHQAAARYHELFAAAGLAESGIYPKNGVILPRELSGSHHVWHQYVIRTPRRDELRDFLTAQQIGSEIYYPVPLHRQKALESLGYAEGSFPEAERAAKEVLALPIFPEIRPDEQERVVSAIAEFLS
ncbi:DegT/DnrJ/EryC1/StrS family aminotransferase [Acidicapsa ligni]|uniref:DegT/DnrJ/EryC1/StrS family aminotransferase n=1 Tax=Acidicapsa ligni TaxID=542300 RepID=UPI0021E0550A|nr:DegT/DnrJ/EryC1/StrS family aminotransferase [Acidicapsa ligni]